MLVTKLFEQPQNQQSLSVNCQLLFTLQNVVSFHVGNCRKCQDGVMERPGKTELLKMNQQRNCKSYTYQLGPDAKTIIMVLACDAK